MRSRERKEKQCLYCSQPIPNRNVYCDNKCQAKHQDQNRHEKLLSGKVVELGTPATVDRVGKRYLIKHYGEKCMECGWCEVNPHTGKIPVELNHIDGDPENNNVENLELLCPNHHALTEFHKSRGKGRKWRKTIFLSVAA